MPIVKGKRCVGTEIEHLMKDKGYERKQAIAAAMAICNRDKRTEEREKRISEYRRKLKAEIALLKQAISEAKSNG